MKGNIPSPRSGHSLTSHPQNENILYLFGGACGQRNTYNDLFSFDFRSFRFVIKQQKQHHFN